MYFTRQNEGFRLATSMRNEGVNRISEFIAKAAQNKPILASNRIPNQNDFQPGSTIIGFGEQGVVFHFVKVRSVEEASSLQYSSQSGPILGVEFIKVPESFAYELGDFIRAQNNPNFIIYGLERPATAFITLREPEDNMPKVPL